MNKKPNIQTQACIGFKLCMMRIKRNVEGDVGKGMFMENLKFFFPKDD